MHEKFRGRILTKVIFCIMYKQMLQLLLFIPTRGIAYVYEVTRIETKLTLLVASDLI